MISCFWVRLSSTTSCCQIFYKSKISNCFYNTLQQIKKIKKKETKKKYEVLEKKASQGLLVNQKQEKDADLDKNFVFVSLFDFTM